VPFYGGGMSYGSVSITTMLSPDQGGFSARDFFAVPGREGTPMSSNLMTTMSSPRWPPGFSVSVKRL